MKITRKSLLSNKYHELELDVTAEQMIRYNNGEDLIQNIFPNLSIPEREFIKSGITPKEWVDEFGAMEDLMKQSDLEDDEFDNEKFVDETER